MLLLGKNHLTSIQFQVPDTYLATPRKGTEVTLSNTSDHSIIIHLGGGVFVCPFSALCHFIISRFYFDILMPTALLRAFKYLIVVDIPDFINSSEFYGNITFKIYPEFFPSRVTKLRKRFKNEHFKELFRLSCFPFHSASQEIRTNWERTEH